MTERGFETEFVRLACIWTWLPGQSRGFCTWVRRQNQSKALGAVVQSQEGVETQVRH